MGVGSEVYGALVNDRRGIGIELKPSYFRQAQKNIREAITKHGQEEDRVLEFQNGDGPAEDDTEAMGT
jgi:hypothetical protein